LADVNPAILRRLGAVAVADDVLEGEVGLVRRAEGTYEKLVCPLLACVVVDQIEQMRDGELGSGGAVLGFRCARTP
jgi:hypothetical protein